ncbi:MAG: hypothetical protein ACUVT5_02345 [Candidatus Bathyarchaeales archaeon]
MKRWITIAGRIGMVLVALSLALYLVSLIPQGTVGLSEKDEVKFKAQTFEIIYTSYRIPLSPQVGVKMHISTNGTLRVKAFDLNVTEVLEWLGEQSPIRNWTTTLLDEFAASHAESLVREQDIPAGNTTFIYIPSKFENSTIIFSNPTSTAVNLSYETSTITVIAEPERILLALMITTPLGITLSMPWIILTLEPKLKPKKQRTL